MLPGRPGRQKFSSCMADVPLPGETACNFPPARGFSEVGASSLKLKHLKVLRSDAVGVVDFRRGPNMRYLRILAWLGICLGSASFAHAQRVVVGVGVGPAYLGPAPVCAYGYYGYYPYACAPYGYYGPDYFVSGVFVGAGPWFHGFYGRPGFYGRGYYGRGYYGRGFEGHE